MTLSQELLILSKVSVYVDDVQAVPLSSSFADPQGAAYPRFGTSAIGIYQKDSTAITENSL